MIWRIYCRYFPHKFRRARKGEVAGTKVCKRCGAVVAVAKRKTKEST